MKKEISEKIKASFWLTITLGVISLVFLLFKFGHKITEYSGYLIAGMTAGLGLGVGVYILERSFYIRYYQQQGSHINYKTSTIPHYIFLLLVFLLITTNQGAYVGLTISIFMTGTTYLLSLAVILYRIRKNKQITIT